MYTYKDLLPYPMISSVEEIALIAIAIRPAGYIYTVTEVRYVHMGSGIYCSLDLVSGLQGNKYQQYMVTMC